MTESLEKCQKNHQKLKPHWWKLDMAFVMIHMEWSCQVAFLILSMSNWAETLHVLQSSSFHCLRSSHNASECPSCTWDKCVCPRAIDLCRLCENDGCRARFAWLHQLCRCPSILKIGENPINFYVNVTLPP